MIQSNFNRFFSRWLKHELLGRRLPVVQVCWIQASGEMLWAEDVNGDSPCEADDYMTCHIDAKTSDFQSPPSPPRNLIFFVFLVGEPKQNLHLPLFSGRGFASQIFSSFLGTWCTNLKKSTGFTRTWSMGVDINTPMLQRHESIAVTAAIAMDPGEFQILVR